MSTKTNKNLYLPQWIQELLYAEKDKPGKIVGAAIFDFCRRPTEEKVKILTEYGARETAILYGTAAVVDENAAGPAGSEQSRKTLVRKSAKSG